jgi:hypothetical protein
MEMCRIRLALYGEEPFIGEAYNQIMSCSVPRNPPTTRVRLNFAPLFGPGVDATDVLVTRYNSPGEGEFGYDAGLHFNLALPQAEELAKKLSGLFAQVAVVLVSSSKSPDSIGGVGFLGGRELDRIHLTIKSTDPTARNWKRSSPGRILIDIEEDIADRLTEMLEE